MNQTRHIIALSLTLLALLAGACSQPKSSQAPMNSSTDANAAFNQLADQYFDEYFRHNPTAATQAGFHQFDAKLEDPTRAEIDREVASLKDFAGRFGKIDAKSLTPDAAGDYELVTSSIKAALMLLVTSS